MDLLMRVVCKRQDRQAIENKLDKYKCLTIYIPDDQYRTLTIGDFKDRAAEALGGWLSRKDFRSFMTDAGTYSEDSVLLSDSRYERSSLPSLFLNKLPFHRFEWLKTCLIFEKAKTAEVEHEQAGLQLTESITALVSQCEVYVKSVTEANQRFANNHAESVKKVSAESVKKVSEVLGTLSVISDDLENLTIDQVTSIEEKLNFSKDPERKRIFTDVFAAFFSAALDFISSADRESTAPVIPVAAGAGTGAAAGAGEPSSAEAVRVVEPAVPADSLAFVQAILNDPRMSAYSIASEEGQPGVTRRPMRNQSVYGGIVARFL